MKKLKKLFNQSGQTAVFFALLLPVLILFLFVVFDLGWLYLNKSRLQNAAEAAVIAGANKFCELNSSYNSVMLIYRSESNNELHLKEPEVQALTETEVQAAAQSSYLQNLGSSADAAEDSWTKVAIQPEYKFYGDSLTAEKIYYEVKLTEDVGHMFKVLNDEVSTEIPVYAVAEITKTVNYPGVPPEGIKPDPETPTTIETVEEIRNGNVVVANWQIQDHYKNNSATTYNGKADIYYKTVLAANKLIPSENLYVGAWNEYQDYQSHYRGADANTRWYRTETINIFDDVQEVTGKDVNGNDITVYTYGKKSSVISTSANINNNNTSDAYNPSALSVVYNSDGTVKYNDEGYIEIEYQKDSAGNIQYDNGKAKLKTTGRANPYTWENLESIDIDVRPDVNFKVKPTEDWDLVSGYFENRIVYIGGDWQGKDSSLVKNTCYLRIHTRVNFGTPYKVRPNKTEPDILWARLESEAMYPVRFNWGSNEEGLNSVRQFIINVEESNFDKDGEKYRPVVIFYDGPEKLEPEKSLRNSRPLIINLNADFRGIIYAPNSSVVFINKNNHQFNGFIIAKDYLRLKTRQDFIDEGIYTEDGTDFKKPTPEPNPYYHADANVTQEPETVNWTYHKVTEYPNPDNTNNGIEMYVDSYGNVAYVKPTEAEFTEMNQGTYDTFNITDFSSHGYHLSMDPSAGVLRSSGN